MNLTGTWPKDAFFYHLFPLGCVDAPARNPFSEDIVHRFRSLEAWPDYLQATGVDALLLGPVMQSSAHGYDVADYFHVDRRLGDDGDLVAFSQSLDDRGIRLVLDAVFHHTGRDFPAFKDVLKHGEASPYRDWYCIDFSRRSPLDDPFHYEGWAGHYDLAKLNLRNPEVCDHLFAAVASWIERFDIDGLRLDAADRLDPDFMRQLAARCQVLKPGFWLMGEVVHGDYRQWANPSGLCSTTNYEAFKGLWSSHNDKNYFEIAYTLNRQSGADGIYRDLDLYTFVDNHDVDRVASTLTEPAHLYPLHILLLTMPGLPSIYYGSEWGMTGRRSPTSDATLRPALSPAIMRKHASHPDLHRAIKMLVALRRQHEALRTGGYTQLHVSHEQFAFMRGHGSAALVVAVNAFEESADLSLQIPGLTDGHLVDVLNSGDSFPVTDGRCEVPVHPRWGRVLILA